MTASFAAYASQFLNRQQQPSSSTLTSQPLFYSFTTDNGSRTGDLSDSDIPDTMLDDDADPHLGRSTELTSRLSEGPLDEDRDDDDPYLRLDEDEQPSTSITRFESDTIPLIASERETISPPRESRQGWLAHQAPVSHRVSPNPPSDFSSESTGTPPAAHARPSRPVPRVVQPNQLTESLLPRDGVTRPVDVFTLPDPRAFSRGRAILKDSRWIAAWLGSVTACVVGSFIILFTTSVSKETHGVTLPYTTLLHTIPLVSILTVISAAVSFAHILLLRIFVKPVLLATSVFIPITLFISAIWAFVGSFMWEEGVEPTWGETTGLRLFSLIPLALAAYTSRRLTRLPQELHTTSSVLALSTSILTSNPLLLALSPLILLLMLIGSIPFLTLSFRLLLIGNLSQPSSNTWEWHVKNWANWSIAGTVVVWLWSWGVARGVLRTTCAAVVGAWYFTPLDVPEPNPLDTFRVHAALHRSTESSLGSIVISALLLTGIRILAALTGVMRRAPLSVLPLLAMPINFLGNLTSTLSSLALIYIGLTGDAFFPSARRAQALVSAITNSSGRVKYRRSGIDPTLSILTITPLTLTLPFALSTYLFTAHTLGAPSYAPVAALLAGGVTALVGRFCVSLVEDVADTLYMCYCIDRDTGRRHQEDVFRAFEWQMPVRSAPPNHPRNIPPTRPIVSLAPPLSQSPSSPIPESSSESEEESYPLQRSSRGSYLGRTRAQSPKRPTVDKLDESRESENMMLGLDFV